MKILVSNHSLEKVGGSETFTYTIIEELKRVGHEVEYFTFNKGFVSDKIEKDLKIPFFSKRNYDLILANHNTTVNHLYRKGFTIQTCHGIFPKLEQPSSNAHAFVSISQEVQDFIARRGYPSILIHNSININRFKPKTKVNINVKSILSLCQSKEANKFIKDICKEQNINYLEAYKFKNPVWNVENLINQVDVVVGLGRSAYEAMACGRPVIIYDNRHYFQSVGDGYIRDILGLSIKNNCSGRYTSNLIDKNTFILELKKYKAEHSNFFRNFALKELNVENNIQKYMKFADEISNLERLKNKREFAKKLKNIIGYKAYKILRKNFK